jgi:hypothetical protein
VKRWLHGRERQVYGIILISLLFFPQLVLVWPLLSGLLSGRWVFVGVTCSPTLVQTQSASPRRCEA